MSRIQGLLREQVRERAGKRCEYCLKPEPFGTHKHQADHILSQRHDGSDTLDNLAWACFSCNVNKGADIAGYDKLTGQLVPLFNPRTQVWDEHFVYDEATLIGLTPIGRVTVHLLQINDGEQIELRRVLIENELW